MRIDERVREGLAGSTRFGDLRLLEETDSTNRVAGDLARRGAAEGVVVSAEAQRAGRGRLGRTWQSAPGSGLLVSVLLRPADLSVADFHLVTAAAALAARDACREVASLDTSIKWPNDLLVGERKLAGILAESAAGAVVVGMGLNVHGGPAGSAVLDVEAGRRVERSDLLVAWLVILDGLLGDWQDVARRYAKACATVGRMVRVDRDRQAPLVGRAERLDSSGRLQVRVEDGSSVLVAAGDVVHLRDDGSPT